MKWMGKEYGHRQYGWIWWGETMLVILGYFIVVLPNLIPDGISYMMFWLYHRKDKTLVK